MPTPCPRSDRHRQHPVPAARARARAKASTRSACTSGWGKDKHERESELDSFDAFYERLRSDPDLPTTSQPSIGDFLAVWEPLLEAGQDIVSVHLAGGISGTCEAARQAHGLLAERGLGERVEVIDGETACGGLGLLVLAGAAPRRAVAPTRTASIARVRETRAALKIWFCIDTLEYLRRGGRVGKAQAWLGGTLRIKPILTLGYEITPVERVRTAGRAFERMVQYMHELREAGSDAWVVQHIQATEQAAAADRPRTRDLRLRAAVRLRGRPRDRHLRRARAWSGSAGCPAALLA